MVRGLMDICGEGRLDRLIKGDIVARDLLLHAGVIIYTRAHRCSTSEINHRSKLNKEKPKVKEAHFLRFASQTLAHVF